MSAYRKLNLAIIFHPLDLGLFNTFISHYINGEDSASVSFLSKEGPRVCVTTFQDAKIFSKKKRKRKDRSIPLLLSLLNAISI